MFRNILVTAALLACACPTTNPPPPGRSLTLLHSNDEHSHLLGLSPEVDDFPAPTTAGTGTLLGGASRRAVVLAAERAAIAAADGGATLTVSAGDNMVGTLAQVADIYPAVAFGSGDYRVLSLLKYDVTTLGNHEFDYGPEELASIITTAKGSTEGIPAIVSSNIHFSGTAGDANLQALFDETGTDSSKPIHRWLVVTASNGLKVGFVGIMGVDASAVAPLKAPVKFSDPAGALAAIYTDLQPVVNTVRSVGKADVVVALSHGNLMPGALTTSEDYLIAQNVSGLDVIVSGHTHTEVPAMLVTNTASGKSVMLQQAGRFGDHIGRISLTVNGDGTVTFDTVNSKLIPIDDTTIPSNAAVNAFVSNVISSIEQTPIANNMSFLQLTLGEIFGTAQPLPTQPGGLAFKSVAGLNFDIDNTKQSTETQLADLVADSMLAAAESVAPTDLAVEAEGELRVSRLAEGKTQKLSFDDLFAAVSLGSSPATLTLGYPLCRFAITLSELKITFEATLSLALEGQSDFFLVPAGFKFEYDVSRNANSRVTRIFKTSTHVGNTYDTYDAGSLVYDATTTGWQVDSNTLVPTTATLYVASFAAVAGVVLLDPDTGQPIPGNDATSTILHRASDGSEIKEWEALGSYVYSQANLPANSGGVPQRYSPTGTVPRRAICFQGGVACP